MLIGRAAGRVEDPRANPARDDDLRPASTFRELHQHFDPVHLRHDEVDRNVGREPLVDGAEKFRGARHESRGQPDRLRNELHHLSDVRIVVEDQQPGVLHGVSTGKYAIYACKARIAMLALTEMNSPPPRTPRGLRLEYLTPNQVADRLLVAPVTVRLWASR